MLFDAFDFLASLKNAKCFHAYFKLLQLGCTCRLYGLLFLFLTMKFFVGSPTCAAHDARSKILNIVIRLDFLSSYYNDAGSNIVTNYILLILALIPMVLRFRMLQLTFRDSQTSEGICHLNLLL